MVHYGGQGVRNEFVMKMDTMTDCEDIYTPMYRYIDTDTRSENCKGRVSVSSVLSRAQRAQRALISKSQTWKERKHRCRFVGPSRRTST